MKLREMIGQSGPLVIRIFSPEMVEAFHGGVESYMPVLGEHCLTIESGDSTASYYNLKLLIGKFGKPFCVERRENGNVLVHFEKGSYLATGFDCGYMGAGPYYYYLKLLIGKFGKPFRVERREDGFLVHFEKGCYLATGFDCGFMGTGPYYFARFGVQAGFGEEDQLYWKLSDMPKDFVGAVWGKKS
jgi:hypothetical protein